MLGKKKVYMWQCAERGLLFYRVFIKKKGKKKFHQYLMYMLIRKGMG